MDPRRNEGEKENPLLPQEAFALAQRQQAAASSELRVSWRLIYGVWSAAFLTGFGALYLQRTILEVVPRPLAGLVLSTAIVAALIVTGVHTSRVSQGLQGETTTARSRIGWAYLAGFAAVAAITVGLFRLDAPEPVISLALPALSLLVIGLLYMASGAYERDRLQFVLGTWILVLDIAAILLGLPWAYLALALGGGGIFLAGALLQPRVGEKGRGSTQTEGGELP